MISKGVIYSEIEEAGLTLFNLQIPLKTIM